MIMCPRCNAQNEDGATFCDQCGNSLSGLSSGGGDQPAPAAMAVGGANCPSCGVAVMPGEAFCENCGASLNAPSPPVQAVTPSPVMPPPVMPPPVMPSPAMPGMGAPVGAAARLLVSSGQTIPLAGKTTYLIGREDPVSGIFPDVDTTASDGEANGVSRRHAQIVQQGAQWFLEDLNSVNGTFVNNQKLAANGRQPLNVGDQIRLGKWLATFQM